MNVPRTLLRSTPEEQGVSSNAISQFLGTINKENLELHSLMILRHGHVIAEGWWQPYQSEHEHMLFSLTKSFTSIGVGFAIAEGLLSLEDTLASFFPEIVVKQHNQFRAIRIRDLLTLSVGHEKATMGWDLQQIEGSWVEHFLNIPLDHEPGTRFIYNTSASHMLSAIIQKVSGLSLMEYLTPRLFEPLGISVPLWQSSPEGHNTGGHGMSLKTEDIAKFGQFLLQQGFWEGRQLLPKNWIKDASSIQITNGDDENDDWQQGYGFQFWLCRYGAFRADGAFGQFCIILPEQDAVVIITSGTNDGDAVLNLIWEYLLPAMMEGPLPVDDKANAMLNNQLNQLMIDTPKWIKASSLAESVTNNVYKMNADKSGIREVSFHFKTDSCTIYLKDDNREHHITCGFQDWIENKTMLFDNVLHCLYQPDTVNVLARAGWRNRNVFEMMWCFVNTAFIDTVVCNFIGQEIQLIRVINTNQDETRMIMTGIKVE
ncbi:serine hydrolase domain-containing protein [Neobacillus sp. NPDC058068]|uniref:serine hydrolase domain-containing protein n=1 Tax=Neobacillus sp. NPDC058068 TaxID=3346325 RepID=UPI0036DF68F0